MSRRPQLQTPARLRLRREQRQRRITTTRSVREAIVSLAGLVNRPVLIPGGAEIGRLVDLVARFSDAQTYPPITGVIVRVGRRTAFLDSSAVAEVAHTHMTLKTASVDLRDFVRRPGEVLLARHVLDHQLVDVDGVQVIRAADLYVAPAQGRIRLVGVDVSVQTLLRRLGPARLRRTPTPDRVIDWAAIQPFGDPVRAVRLRTSHSGLNRLRPGELADLLEDLGRDERQELLDSLEPETAADALEEMDPDELESLLREVEPERAASLLASMETDEAADALRDLKRDEREELLGHMPQERAEELSSVLSYEEDCAGGIMTTAIVCVAPEDTVATARQRLAAMREHRGELDGVVVVDEEGRLLGDVHLFDLAVAGENELVAALVPEEEPVTVAPAAPVKEVAVQLIEARRSSVLVVDEAEHPVGRILADDVVDALVPERGRIHFPRLLE